MVPCAECKYYEPFNGVCCNGDSKYCADFPGEHGVTGCDRGEADNSPIQCYNGSGR